jgi:hypothetical protein
MYPSPGNVLRTPGGGLAPQPRGIWEKGGGEDSPGEGGLVSSCRPRNRNEIGRLLLRTIDERSFRWLLEKMRQPIF